MAYSPPETEPKQKFTKEWVLIHSISRCTVAVLIAYIVIEFGQRIPNEIALIFGGSAFEEGMINLRFVAIQLPLLFFFVAAVSFVSSLIAERTVRKYLIVLSVMLFLVSAVVFVAGEVKTPLWYHIARFIMVFMGLYVGAVSMLRLNTR